MAREANSGREDALAEALEHLEKAIELLDRAGAPANIAAHVDLGRCQLRDLVAADPGISTTRRLAD